MFRIQNRVATMSIAVVLSLALIGGSFAIFTPQAHAATNEEIKALITTLLEKIALLQSLIAERNSAEGGFKGESFSIGDEIVTVSILKVRSEALVTENVIAYAQTAAKGTIVAGPETNGGYTWWKVAYTNGVTGWSAANWLHATGAYTAPSGVISTPAATEKLGVKIVTPNSGSYAYGDVLTVTWEQTGEVPKDSKACVILRNQDTDKNFAFPGSGSCVDIAGAEPTRTLAAKLERTSGYDLTPGKYSVQVTLSGPSLGYKDGATLAIDKSDRAITIGDVTVAGTIDAVNASENPTFKGSATGASEVALSIAGQYGDKVYGSGMIPVINGYWSHKVTTDLADGTYTAKLYINNRVVDQNPPFRVGEAEEPSAGIASVTNEENPLITGTATGVNQVTVSIAGPSGDKVYGSGPISVVNERWSHRVTTDLADGAYTFRTYIDGMMVHEFGETILNLPDATTLAQFKAVLNGSVIKTVSDVTKQTASDSCRVIYNDYATYHFTYGDVLECYWNGEKFLTVDGWKG